MTVDDLHETLARARTLTFDCYGTLIDWSRGLGRVFREVFGLEVADRRHDELFAAYVQIEAEIEAEPYRLYREVLGMTLERLAAKLGLPLPPDKKDELAAMLATWTPFADTNDALARLKKKFRLGVLSNIDRDLFAGTARHFSVAFDFLICAEDVRSYKPAPGHFERLRQEEGSLDHVIHVAQSLYHDGAAAKKLDLAFVWINRYSEPRASARADVRPYAEFPDLRSFAEAACRQSPSRLGRGPG